MNEKHELTDEQIEELHWGELSNLGLGFARAIITADRALRASPAVGDVAMPKFPPAVAFIGPGWGFTEDQMREYTRAALAAKDAEIGRLKAEAAFAGALVSARDSEIAALTAARDALREDAVQRRRMTGIEITEMLDRICVYTGDRETAVIQATEKWHKIQ